jgi:hypothetical protein
MPPFGPFYPLVLQAVMNHAERLAELLAQRERVTRDFDVGGVWLIGRATELQCVAAMIAVDWQERRLPTAAAAGKLARYVRELHDGLAMHLDVAVPACCHAPPAATRPGVGEAKVWRPSLLGPRPAKCGVDHRKTRNRPSP